MVIAAGAVAAMTVIGAGLVQYPVDAGDAETAGLVASTNDKATKSPAKDKVRKKTVKRPVRYVRLKPGQKAPKGATVIQEKARAPRVVVRRVNVPNTRTAAPTRVAQPSRKIVTRTRQSG
jgi:hypothetical protein